jgi:MYXO-CTERM domain-containing protein
MMHGDLKTRRSIIPCAALAAAESASLSCAPADPFTGERPYQPANPYPEDNSRHDTFVPNPDFVPVTREIETRRFALRQEGEVLVVEGDARTVSSDGAGNFGITEDNAAAVIQDVLAMYPDEFDTIQLYLTFPDAAAGGAAYYSSISNSVQGIGSDVFNGRPAFGLPEEGRLSGWSNMNDMQSFGDLLTLAIPKGPYYSVISQELSHRWLMTLVYKVGTTNLHDLKGRQDAHWSALVHAYGSVQDGISWIDNGDGTFTHDGESNNGFAPFDQYAMGILREEDVEPTFKITSATFNGMELTATSHSMLPRGTRINGTRSDPITAEQLRLAMGPRNPPAGTETPYYRVAFVLVTAPGQSRTAWEPYLEKLKEIQESYPDTWREWTNGAGAICTRVSSRCPEPVIGIESFRPLDGNDNLLAPGENFELELAIRNDGLGTAEDVRVTIEPVGAGVTITNGQATAPPLAERSSAVLPRFSMAIGAEVPCAEVVQLRVTETTREGPSFSQVIELGVGTRVERFDPLEEAPDWLVDPDGTDTASTGVWQLGEPELVTLLGEVTQPGEDHTPGGGKLSFGTVPARLGNPARGDVDLGKTTLQSPVFALREMRDPTLVFYAWHLAKNFTRQPPEDVPSAALVIRGTDDGGDTWHEMGRVTENTAEWTRVALRIKDQLELTNRVRFRFEIAEEESPGVDPLIEAAIDDLQIVDYLEGCELPMEETDAGVVMPGPPKPNNDRDEGCGCTSASSGSSALAALFFLALLLAGRAKKR